MIGDEVLLARDKLASVNLHIAGLTGSIYTDSALPLGELYYSAPLSDIQWQLEVEQMHNIALAKMRQQIILRPSPDAVVLGYTYGGKNFIVPPGTDASRRLCSQQKVRSQVHVSFNVFGFFLTVCFGLCIIALRFSLPSIVGWIQKQRRSPRHHSRTQSWTQMDIPHLISFSLEYFNNAMWEGRDKSVPVTIEYGKKLKWASMPASVGKDDVKERESSDC